MNTLPTIPRRFSFLILPILILVQVLDAQQLSGELRQWHRVTLSFQGPQSAEDAEVNPFLDYRLDVTFRGPSAQVYVVPGFFAADGNAAETSATSGNVWQVRFSPDETGTWNYEVSFRTGQEVAISTNANAGVGTAFDGTTGNFQVAPSNKNLPDNRARGRLAYAGGHYLQWQGDGSYFLKAGADSPENLLAYGDFDNTVDKKDWSPHVGDWNNGDPTWRGGKGKGLIGAVNYLSGKGMNAFSFLSMNIKGDGKDVWPYAATANSQLDGDTGSDASNRLRFDVSKLEQWEILFDHAETKGMYLHFKTQETENDQLLDGGNLGTQRRLYYRELIARFGHHLALNWNIGEENTQSTAQRKDCAAFFEQNDPYGHLVVIHTYPGDKQKVYPDLLGNASSYTGASLQNGVGSNHNDVKTWVERSREAGKPWVVANDEQGNAQTGVAADASYSGNRGNRDDNRATIRKEVLWGTLMAGGAGVEYYFGYATGETDLTAEDFRSRRTKWEDAKIALDFFQANVPFTEMRSRDGLVSGSNFCFSELGKTYLVYLKDGGTATLDLNGYPGEYSVKWFDPRNGGALQDGSISRLNGGASRSLGNPPNTPNQDWAVLLVNENPDAPDGGGDEGNGDEGQGDLPACEGGYVEQDGLVVIEAESIAANGWVVQSAAAGYSGSGYISWEQGNQMNNPGQGLISVPIRITNPGTYRFEWRNKVGEGSNATESNDSWLRFDDADDFFGRKSNGSVVYPKGRGKSPNPNGSSSEGWFKVYSSGALDWKWSTRTSDNDAHDIFVTFNRPGVYTMEISARSQHHFIDRIVLHREADNPRDLSNPETPCDPNVEEPMDPDEPDMGEEPDEPDMGEDPDEPSLNQEKLRIVPNPIGRGSTFRVHDLPAGTYELTLFTIQGQVLNRTTVNVTGVYEGNANRLLSGLYVISFANASDVLSAKLVIE